MKPIFITPEQKEELLREFQNDLELGLYDGSFTFSKSFTFPDKTKPRATLLYTPLAFAKTVMLLKSYDSEVAWHALIKRGDVPGDYIVYDVIVYPQTVTGVTVNTDDKGYAEFMTALSDEQANFMHAQCHSHVNMSTSPSAVDTKHQSDVLKMMNGEGFYMFQIWNKRLESSSFIYDFDNNIMYETKDIDVEILDENGFILSDFVEESKAIVKKQAYAATYPSSGYSSSGYGASAADNARLPASQEYGYDEDDADYLYPPTKFSKKRGKHRKQSWASGYYESGMYE